jgi:histidinol dehydrogenase
MPELSIGGLYQRIRPAAAAYLGERSPSTLLAYVSGYDDGLAHYGAAPLLEELPYEHLDLFLQGADSDARDPTMDKMIAAIVAKTRGLPDGDDDGG